MNTFNKQIISQSIPVTILLITIYSVLPFAKEGVPMIATLNNTTIWWGISFLILLVFFCAGHYFFDKRNANDMRVVAVYLVWNAICVVRGMFVAEAYWDWKGLIGNAMALMLPVVIYAASNKRIVQSMLYSYVKYAVPLFFLFAFVIRPDAFGFYLIPVSFLILFFPALTTRQKLILLFFTLVIFIADLGARSNVIKFSIPFALLVIYYLRKKISAKMIEITRIALFVIPLTLFLLGVTGIFNVFQIDNYVGGDYTTMGTDGEGNRVEINVTTDTRTFLYAEVLQSAVNNDYWLLGRTPARGNDSDTFGLIEFQLTKRYERLQNEIGLANVFTWTGIIGVALYFLIFWRASYLAVNKSKNIFVKMLGIYVAFRWLYSWVEDINNFSLNYFMLMLMIGLCFSHSFREMNNKEVTIWIRGVFDVRYVQLQNYLAKKQKYENAEHRGAANVP